ncbi:MAG: phage head-tail connector protein [Candidatus Geothermarchaeales archaeon]
MAYGTLSNVKTRLNIKNTDYDAEITEILGYVSRVMDQTLGLHTDVPLPSPPDEINDVADDLAELEFRRRRLTPSEARLIDVREKAKEYLQPYLMRVYGRTFVASGSAEEAN